MSTKNKKVICMVIMLIIVIQVLSPMSAYAHTANGHYTTSQVPGKWVKVGDYWYWQKTNGTNLTSAFLDYDGNTYYLAANGVMGVGWMKIDGNWYYFQSWGGMYKSTFFDYDGNTYYVDANGVMAIGWKKIGSYWYYFRSWGGMYKDTFVEYDGNTYYLAANGVMGVGWMLIDGNWYYFQSWGGAVKGWEKLVYKQVNNGKEYWNYFNSSGVFITDSDVEGCSHGRSTFHDYHLITGIPFRYYTNLGTSQDANVDTAAKAWGTKYLQKTNNSNNATLTFKYDSFINTFKSGQTFYTIDWSTVEYPTGNYDEAIIKFNRDLGVASSSTAAHEIGHALGLTHRMTEKKSIMYPTLEGREVNTPQSTDFSNAVHVN